MHQPNTPDTRHESPTAASQEAATAPGFSGRLPALDSVRGVAILLVMGYHFNQAIEDSSPAGSVLNKFLTRGDLGVDLFFVLSGFLITGILHDTKGGPRYFRNFYLRRTLRIFPVYYGLLFACFVLLPPLLGRWDRAAYADTAPYQGWLWLYGTNIIQAWHGQWFLTGFNHFWSLAVEEHFYLLWPLVIYLCSRRAAMALCGVCVLVALVSRMAFAAVGNPVAEYALTPCRLDALAAGALLALAVRGPGGLHAIRRWVAAAAGVSITVLVALFLVPQPQTPRAGAVLLAARGTFYACLFAAVIFWSVTAAPSTLWGRFGSNGPLHFFGKYSYGLYVFHYPLLPLLEYCFAAGALAVVGGSVFLGKLLYMAAATAATVLVALLSWHLYEKHCLRLKDVLAPKEKGRTR